MTLGQSNERAWDFAVGIVQTEGIKPSDFMLKLIEREKRGEITGTDIDRILIEEYTVKGA
ncbi:MAG: antitoxin VbhA family protein [Defluviitaleaceae bacterium]|nr:antitoxin VbhA family protein [Defluviitaleaceae bacterium]